MTSPHLEGGKTYLTRSITLKESMIKLEVGKTYLTRSGECRTITRISDGVAYDAYGSTWWVMGGQKNTTKESPEDLVEQVVVDVDVMLPGWQAAAVQPAIPNADLIRAVLDGKTVQWRTSKDSEWRDLSSFRGALICLAQAKYDEVRLKPEPVVRWVPVFFNIRDTQAPDFSRLSVGNFINAGSKASSKEEALTALCNHDREVLLRGGNGYFLVLTFDPDTGQLLSTCVEQP